MSERQGPWILNRNAGWVMPAGTSYGSEAIRMFGEAHGYEPFSSESVDAYLRSIGAVPFSEYADAALAALAELKTVAERMATYLRECLGCNACKGCVEEECGIHEDLAALDAWKKANP